MSTLIELFNFSASRDNHSGIPGRGTSSSLSLFRPIILSFLLFFPVPCFSLSLCTHSTISTTIYTYTLIRSLNADFRFMSTYFRPLLGLWARETAHQRKRLSAYKHNFSDSFSQVRMIHGSTRNTRHTYVYIYNPESIQHSPSAALAAVEDSEEDMFVRKLSRSRFCTSSLIMFRW